MDYGLRQIKCPTHHTDLALSNCLKRLFWPKIVLKDTRVSTTTIGKLWDTSVQFFKPSGIVLIKTVLHRMRMMGCSSQFYEGSILAAAERHFNWFRWNYHSLCLAWQLRLAPGHFLVLLIIMI